MISTLSALRPCVRCYTPSSINVVNCTSSTPSPPQMSHDTSAWTYATTFSSPMITLILKHDAMLVNSRATCAVNMNVTLWVDARKCKCMFRMSPVTEVSVKNNYICQLAIPSKVVVSMYWHELECIHYSYVQNWSSVWPICHGWEQLLNFTNVVSTTPNYSLGSMFSLSPIHLPHKESKYCSVYSD
jgi:hypothetical protein